MHEIFWFSCMKSYRTKMVLSLLVIQASSRDSMVFWGTKRQEHLDDVFSSLCKQMGGRRVSGRRLRREEIFYSKHCWEQTSLAFQVRILKGIERPEKRAPGFYRFDRGWNPTRTVINHYKDLYQTTSIVESKRAFFVAHFLLDNGWFLDLLILGNPTQIRLLAFSKGTLSKQNPWKVHSSKKNPVILS